MYRMITNSCVGPVCVYLPSFYCEFPLEIYHSQVLLGSRGTITEMSPPLLGKVEHMFQARSVELFSCRNLGVEQRNSKLGELF